MVDTDAKGSSQSDPWGKEEDFATVKLVKPIVGATPFSFGVPSGIDASVGTNGDLPIYNIQAFARSRPDINADDPVAEVCSLRSAVAAKDVVPNILERLVICQEGSSGGPLLARIDGGLTIWGSMCPALTATSTATGTRRRTAALRSIRRSGPMARCSRQSSR